MTATASRSPGANLRRILAWLLVVILIIGMGLGRRQAAPALTLLLDWVRGAGAAGWAIAALAQMLVATTGILPASLTGLAAGALYGILAGFLIATAGTLLGALTAFLLSRSLLRPLIVRWLRPGRPGRRTWVMRLDAAIARDGWRTVCLLRLSPIMPFAATSYLLGLTGVSLGDYLLGTLASLPALFGYVVLGHLAGLSLTAVTAGAGVMRWILLGVGMLATLAVTMRIGRLTQRSELRLGATDAV